jgi:hypothetical protein
VDGMPGYTEFFSTYLKLGIVMGFDIDRQAAKHAELVAAFGNALRQHRELVDSEFAAGKILDAFCRVTPPEESEVYMELVTVASFSGRGGGTSSKPGNIRLNLRLLFDAVASGTFTVLSLKGAPWAVPLAAILLWNSLWRAAQVQLTEKEVAILWTLWRIRDAEKYVKEELLRPALADHVTKNGIAPITDSDLRHGLEKLAAIETIARSKRESAEWRLIEWIQKSYR